MLLGDASDFHVNMLGHVDAGTRPLYFAFGAFAGLLAVAYNRVLLATLATTRRLIPAPIELRAGLVGAAVGILGWFAPDLIGGGDAITQSVLAGSALPGLPGLPGRPSRPPASCEPPLLASCSRRR